MYSQDWMIGSVIIDSTNNQIVIDEGAGNITITLDTGEYWLHAQNNATYPGLYYEIGAKIAASAATRSYSFTSRDPSQSTEQTDAGIRVTNSSTTAVTWKFADANFTLSPRYFGFAEDEASTASVSNGSLCELIGKYTALGIWKANALHAGNIASRKHSKTVRPAMYLSHDRAADRYVMDWYQERRRRYLLEYIPAAHIWESRGAESDYAATADLATGDINNAFETCVWETLQRNSSVVVLHNDQYAVWNLEIDNALGDFSGVEVVKLADVKQMQDLEECVSLMRTAGELYALDLDLVITANIDDGYSH